MQQRLPFTISKTESFYDKLGEWIGDVFYDHLPAAGLELRDEQIFMAFQLEQAFKDKKVIFAEAGVGTGKTIVYLLYAICFARYTNRPAIIACADETLIEQLVKKEGDIAKLEQILSLQIDVRLAKSRDQYICLNKLEQVLMEDDHELFARLYDSLPDFIHFNESMQSFDRYGDRKDYPYMNDEEWEKISWDSLQNCFTCEKRHRCGQTLHRDYYRTGKELIICSHDFYMEHVWTKEARKREGQLPLLPESCSVVFDEGHLLEFAAQKALTYKISETTIETLLVKLRANDVREQTLLLIEQIIELNNIFFAKLHEAAIVLPDSEKQTIVVNTNNQLNKYGKKLFHLLQQLEEELVFESELYVINTYDLKIVEEYLEQMSFSLSLFLKQHAGISWLEEINGERTLVIMPKLVKDILRDEVFSDKKPYVFSSATLSENKSFQYMSQSLGIQDFYSFSVASPYCYEKNMTIYLQQMEPFVEMKCRYVIKAIEDTNGGALVLFSNRNELQAFKTFLSEEKTNLSFLFEGDHEISSLVQQFQQEKDIVLCSDHLWEGLDVPGLALRNVIIFSLPFPPNDPVFHAKRESTNDPFLQVDLPYMLLRLRQGIGRLIRTHEDKGVVHILLDDDLDSFTVSQVKNVLPNAHIIIRDQIDS